MTNRLTVYGPEFSSYVRSVLICCEEKGLSYQRQDIAFGSPELLGMNPFGKIPVIQAGDVTLFESQAICFFIDKNFPGPPLTPSDVHDFAIMQQWISVANCYLDREIIRNYVLEFAFPSGPEGKFNRDKIDKASLKIQHHLKILGHYLLQAEYFSGPEAGISDYLIIPMLHYLGRAPKGKNIIDQQPSISRYIAQMLQRESCLKILL